MMLVLNESPSKPNNSLSKPLDCFLPNTVKRIKFRVIDMPIVREGSLATTIVLSRIAPGDGLSPF